MLIGRGRGVGGKRCAVIDLLIVVRVPHNTILVDFATLNLEPAVLNHELDVGEVLIGVGELLLGKVHVVGANSGALCGSIARELNVGLCIEAVIGGEFIASHGLRGAVVGLNVLLALDGDGDLIGNRVHLQSAVLGLGEGVVVRARIGVERIGIGVFLLANVGDGAGVGKGRTLTLGEARHGFHLVLGVLVTVIGPLVRGGFHGDSGLVDDERTVLGRNLKLVRHIVAVSVRHHSGAGDVVGVGARVGLDRVLGSKARDGIHVALDRELIGLDASGRVLLAIIGSGGRVGLDRDLVLGVTVGDGQRTLGLGNVVVLGLGAFVQRIAESVGARADNSLGSREDIGRSLTLGEAGNLKRSLALAAIFVCESRSVVALGEVGGLQGHDNLGNVNVAVGHVKGDVGKVGCIGVGELARQAHLGLAGIGAGNLAIARERNFVLRVVRIVGRKGIALGRKLFAVVGANFGFTNNGDRYRGRNGVNRQLTLGFCNSVITVLALGRAAGELISESVVARTSISLRSSHIRRKALAVNEAVTGNRNSIISKGIAVVGLFVSRRGQRDRTLRNGHRAVFDLEGDVREILICVLELFGAQAHLSSARIGARRSRGAAESKVSFGRGVERGLLAIDSHTGNFVARDALLRAVVLLAIFITFDFNNNDSMRSGDLEGARLGGDVVVLSLRVALEHIRGNLVAGTTDLKLTARNSHGAQTLIANKSTVSDVITIVGQSGAAVRPIIAFCSKFNVDGLNNELLGAGNVATLAIVCRRRDADIHNFVLADIHGIDLIAVSGPVAV